MFPFVRSPSLMMSTISGTVYCFFAGEMKWHVPLSLQVEQNARPVKSTNHSNTSLQGLFCIMKVYRFSAGSSTIRPDGRSGGPAEARREGTSRASEASVRSSGNDAFTAGPSLVPQPALPVAGAARTAPSNWLAAGATGNRTASARATPVRGLTNAETTRRKWLGRGARHNRLVTPLQEEKRVSRAMAGGAGDREHPRAAALTALGP
jgi:hypothetical protein